MSFLIIVTLLFLALPAYVYIGYPLLLWVLVFILKPNVHKQSKITPTVTLVVSCYNEAAVIREKLKNCLALAYPQEKLNILIVSDASDDGTDDIVKEYEGNRIKLIRQENRLGKTMGLNLALQNVNSEIVVFSDANAMYASDAILKLVRNFAQDNVGYVVGAALYIDKGTSSAADSEGMYWRYELAIKTLESRLHSVVGGDGAIYAIRSSLWEPLQAEDINDFVNPLQIIGKGFRGKFEPEAKCYEETAGSFDKEGKRKLRIVNRSFRGLLRVASVMNPVKYGFFALEVISHKLLRWFIPFFLTIGLVGSCILSLMGSVPFILIITTAWALVVFAMVGMFTHERYQNVILSTPYYFIVVNLMAMLGIIKALGGYTQITWESTRSDGENKKRASSTPIGLLAFIVILTTLSVILLSSLKALGA